MDNQTEIAIISATSALGGVIVSQIFSLIISVYDKKHEKRKLLRQKFEEMMFYFTMSFNWFQQINNCTSKKEIYSLAQSLESRKALTLCLLYFPELAEAANKYLVAQTDYYQSIVCSFNENINSNAGAQSYAHSSTHLTVEKNLFDTKNYFENLIIKNSKKYIIA